MSEAVSVMKGATAEGAVTLTDMGLTGMVTLRGDLSSDTLAKAVKSVTGLALPGQRGVKTGAKGGVAWMSPDELMLFTDYAQADAAVTKLDKALDGEYHLAVNVSDARAHFRLTGEGVREVIAKGSPANLAPEALPVGELRRTRLGQVAVAFWLTDETTLDLVCFRSVGEFVWDWLNTVNTKGSLPGVL